MDDYFLLLLESYCSKVTILQFLATLPTSAHFPRYPIFPWVSRKSTKMPPKWVSFSHTYCCWLLFSVWVTSLDQAFSNIPHYKISNKRKYDSCWYRIGSISVSASTQGCNIGIVSEMKKFYRDIPTGNEQLLNFL